MYIPGGDPESEPELANESVETTGGRGATFCKNLLKALSRKLNKIVLHHIMFISKQRFALLSL